MKVEQLVNEAIEAGQGEPFRYHLGASIIGRECEREIWYTWRWATEKYHEARLLRLFSRGHREEEVVLEYFRKAGLEVYEKDPETGEQFRLIALGGHFGGSLDGVIKSIPDVEGPVLFECKTASAKNFARLVKNGVRKEKHEHYVQMQIYMHTYKLKYALYVCVNKDTDDWHFELIEYNEGYSENYMQRAANIISSDKPPMRINNDPTWFKCKFCDHRDVCHFDAEPAVNCRTCAHSRVGSDGRWHCELLPTYKIRTNDEAEKNNKPIVHIPCKGLKYERAF